MPSHERGTAARLYSMCGGFLTFDQSVFTHMQGMGTPVEVPTFVVLLYVLVSMYGATRRATILRIVLAESSALALIGGIAGVVSGHGVAWLGTSLLAARSTLVPHPFAAGVLKLVVLTLR